MTYQELGLNPSGEGFRVKKRTIPLGHHGATLNMSVQAVSSQNRQVDIEAMQALIQSARRNKRIRGDKRHPISTY